MAPCRAWGGVRGLYLLQNGRYLLQNGRQALLLPAPCCGRWEEGCAFLKPGPSSGGLGPQALGILRGRHPHLIYPLLGPLPLMALLSFQRRDLCHRLKTSRAPQSLIVKPKLLILGRSLPGGSRTGPSGAGGLDWSLSWVASRQQMKSRWGLSLRTLLSRDPVPSLTYPEPGPGLGRVGPGKMADPLLPGVAPLPHALRSHRPLN